MKASWGKVRIGVVAIFCAVALAIVGLHRFSGRAYSQPPTPPLFVTDRCTGAVTAYPAGSNGDVSPLAPAPTGLAGPGYVAIDASGHIYALNLCNNTITVYAKGSNGDAAPTAIIGGSNTGLSSPEDIAVDSGANIYVLDGGSCCSFTPSVFVYAAGSNGNVAPIATISGSNTGFIAPSSIALDSSGNIYVADTGESFGEGPGSVFVYPPVGSSTGLPNESPIATITGFNTGLVTPIGIAVDSSHNIYVVDDGMKYSIISPPSVYVFSAGSYGDVPPIATISGSNTGVNFPYGIAVDSSGKIYVANSYPSSMTVYPALGSSTGLPNESPIATITPGITNFALDSSGNIYATDAYPNSVTVYPALGSKTGTVNESPIATISTSMTTGLYSAGGIAVDSSGKIYVPGVASNTYAASVFVYPEGSNANVAPTATISGLDTLLETPTFVAVDSSGKIYVADDDRVLVYPAGSTGNVPPIATISGPDLDEVGSFAVDSSGNIYVPDPNSLPPSVDVYSGSTGTPTAFIVGPNTGLEDPEGIALDSSGNIYVLDWGAESVFVYPPLGSSTGRVNEPPTATISGTDTGLTSPESIALDSSRNIYVADEGNPYNGIPASVFAYPALGGSGWIAGPPATYSEAPTATISGPLTELLEPQFVAIQPAAGPTPTPTATSTAATPTATQTPTATPTGTPTPISEKLTISPSSLAFADKVKVGTTSKPKTVTIKNAGKKKKGLAVSIESESASPPVFAVTSECEETLEPGKSCKVSVTFTPADTTRQTGSLKIVDNVIGEPQSVGLSGTGKAAKKK
jgi:sugar lactone lactonase YvrE